ncbi:hypothetical protein GCM10023194_02740 [Planotetraspora phitsanulokensis]|uniref:Uncharacterized protein n=1 Tax=Planotetraspora phitsanulokensis TaxID=575192 RepID=A0A8J3U8W4_9ACTN|nr:hypothetical protein [Planotetraspora phitsanulokensis]GII40450.1 hypothetical protein Pph01_54530 [Planotetraspora phitsanulokensis]
MTEFVGLRPDGARELCTTMGDVLQQISPLKSALSSGISEAGDDCPSTARGTAVLDRYGTFLTDARRDLAWRVTDADVAGVAAYLMDEGERKPGEP